MIAVRQASGERERLARLLLGSGAMSVLSLLPGKDSLLVLTYHRVGDSEQDPWDPGIFSATGDEFDEQIAYLKRQYSLVTLEEALAFVEGTEKDKTPHCRVLVTFDDGYLDNYEIAYPILRSHGAQGVFFLCSNLVGSGHVPWWDHIAFLVKSAAKKRFILRYPTELDINVDKNGLKETLQSICDLFKTPGNLDPERFMEELTEVAGANPLLEVPRRFLNWDEAREMISGGMALGAHTHTHPMLSKLDGEDQRRELTLSRAILSEKLRIKADTFAYPFGSRTAFTKETQRIAEETGFRAAFSYYGRLANQRGTMDRFDLKRVSVGAQSWGRMQVQAGISRITGIFWP
jgi:peptidoglycan/xylan/chitin deacetylase (PgdA/CDA1 family)